MRYAPQIGNKSNKVKVQVQFEVEVRLRRLRMLLGLVPARTHVWQAAFRVIVVATVVALQFN